MATSAVSLTYLAYWPLAAKTLKPIGARENLPPALVAFESSMFCPSAFTKVIIS
jgi:hypothetical protein